MMLLSNLIYFLCGFSYNKGDIQFCSRTVSVRGAQQITGSLLSFLALEDSLQQTNKVFLELDTGIAYKSTYGPAANYSGKGRQKWHQSRKPKSRYGTRNRFQEPSLELGSQAT